MRDEIRLWIVSLDVPGRAERLATLLSAEERARAARYRDPRDARRSIVARAVLRLLVGRGLGLGPADVPLRLGPAGKPALADDAASLRFNVAHSRGLAVYVLAHHREVGIDVEHVPARMSLAPLVGRILTLDERAALAQLPERAQPEMLLRYWTRKEAVLKGEGVGLGMEPKRIGTLRRIATIAGASSRRWVLRDLHPAAGYVGALAVEGHGWRLCCRRERRLSGRARVETSR